MLELPARLAQRVTGQDGALAQIGERIQTARAGLGDPRKPVPGCGRDRYGYNEWGELTTRRDQQLEWNAQGQLTRVISGNTETHHGYDALGRRTRKATYGRHTGHTARSRTDFVWEGFRLLQENVQQQGWRTYLYDAEQPYTPVASVTGKGESRQVWYYHTDVTGTPQEVTAADGTLVWRGISGGLEKMRRTSATAERTFTSRCGCRGSILTTRQGCITICSDIMHRSVAGSSVRIRLG